MEGPKVKHKSAFSAWEIHSVVTVSASQWSSNQFTDFLQVGIKSIGY